MHYLIKHPFMIERRHVRLIPCEFNRDRQVGDDALEHFQRFRKADTVSLNSTQKKRNQFKLIIEAIIFNQVNRDLTYVSHVLSGGLQKFQRGRYDVTDEIPLVSLCRSANRYVGQIAEYVIEFSPLFAHFAKRFETIAYDYLKNNFCCCYV